MSTKTFRTIISVPTKIALDKECTIVTMPTANGYIGILPNHTPIVGAITPGYIKLTYSDGTKHVGLVNYGLYSFRNNELSILSDLFEFSCHGVDSNAIAEIQEKVEQDANKIKISAKTAKALNSYMSAVTATARKASKNK